MNNRTLIINIVRFIGLILIQGLILNNILVAGYINPQLYVLFILLLPFETPKWLLLISAFFIGILAGLFTNSSGAHAAASTLIAFIRPSIIKALTPKRELEAGVNPGIHNISFRWFFFYSFILISIHHLSLFFLDAFSFNNSLQTLLLSIGTIVCSLVLAIISQYLFPSKRRSVKA
jgi:rod shape-determining protein MreD